MDVVLELYETGYGVVISAAKEEGEEVKELRRISRMLARYNIKSVAIPPREISSYMPPTKDALGLRTPGIYRSSVNAARCTSDRADGPSS